MLASASSPCLRGLGLRLPASTWSQCFRAAHTSARPTATRICDGLLPRGLIGYGKLSQRPHALPQGLMSQAKLRHQIRLLQTSARLDQSSKPDIQEKAEQAALKAKEAATDAAQSVSDKADQAVAGSSPKEPSEKLLNLPNVLTLSRIASTPFLGYLIIQDRLPEALVLLFVASCTDLLDGYLARKWNAYTVFGSIADPAADKLLMTVMVATLGWKGILPSSLAALILLRDVGLVLLAFRIRYTSLPRPMTLQRYFNPRLPSAQVEPTQISKYNTFLQLVSVGGALLHATLLHDISGVTGSAWAETLYYPLVGLWLITASTTVISGWGYFVGGAGYKNLPRAGVAPGRVTAFLKSKQLAVKDRIKDATSRRSFSTSPTGRSPAADPSSSSPRPRRSSSKRLSAQPGADLVGPPDALSNLRPVVYGSAFETMKSGEKPSAAADSTSNSPSPPVHPYSTSEFTSSASLGPTSSFGEPHSAYFVSLLQRLEVAELEHHLRRSRSDRFSQSFWSDNNARYEKALGDEFSQGSRPGAAKSEDVLAPFYAAWLSANSQRHKAYNDRLWAMTREDLGPAMRYSLLRWWVGVVRWWEAKMGRGSSSSSSSSSSGRADF